jgi:hypothetical protein
MDDLARRLDDSGLLDRRRFDECRRYADSPCGLVEWLVCVYFDVRDLPAALDEIESWIADAFNGAVKLIRPQGGDTFDDREHTALRVVPASRGRKHAVLRVSRPGLRCGDAVRLKAEVEVSA